MKYLVTSAEMKKYDNKTKSIYFDKGKVYKLRKLSTAIGSRAEIISSL